MHLQTSYFSGIPLHSSCRWNHPTTQRTGTDTTKHLLRRSSCSLKTILKTTSKVTVHLNIEQLHKIKDLRMPDQGAIESASSKQSKAVLASLNLKTYLGTWCHALRHFGKGKYKARNKFKRFSLRS